MTAPRWAEPLSFDGLELNLSELDLMADLDPYWIGWAAEAVTGAALGLLRDEGVATADGEVAA